MGVGGDTSWGARPHAPYRLPAKTYEYRFKIRPFGSEEKTFYSLALEKF
jgi:beta-galactosidase